MTPPGHILVVDDTHASLKLLAGLLTTAGHRVQPADSGPLALAAAAADPPELVLLDLRMPGMDGFEVIRRLQASPATRATPVIFLTAETDEHLRLEGLKRGAVDFITKPFHDEELLIRVSTHLELSRSRAHLAAQAAELQQINARLHADITERQRTEAALRESEALTQSILENLSDAVLLTQPDGTILSANPAACRLFDRTEEEIRRGGRSGLVDTTDSRLPVLLARRAETGRVRGELTFLRRDGTRFEGECASSLFTDAAGHSRTSMVIRDLTAQRLAAEKLERAAQEWQTTFDATRDAVWILDRDSRIVRANRAAEQRFGRSTGEMAGHPCWEIAHGSTQPIHHCPLQRAARSLQRETSEIAHGGQWCEVTVDPILDPAGRFAGAVHSVSDITARKRTAIALAESEARFSATFEQAAVGIAQVGLDGRWLRVNQRLCHIVGYTREELLQRTFQDITHPDDLATDLGFVRKVLAGELQTYTMEKRYLRKDRSVVTINLTVSLVREESGEPHHFISVIEDITERQRAEQALHESERFARATIDALSAHLCVLDETGLILTTNQAWRHFAEGNPPVPGTVPPGANYLAVCDAATGPEAGDAHAFAAGIRSVLSGAHPSFSLEYPCHSPTEQRWFVGRVTRFAGSGPVRLVVVHEAITERRQAEEALRITHANLERLVDERTAALAETNRLLAQTSHLARVGGWEVDLHTGTNTWSGATREIHEVDEQFVPTVETALGFYAPEARPLISAAVQRTVTTGEPFDLELPFITARGHHLWVRAVGQAYRNNGAIVKLGGVFQDITARRQAEDVQHQHRVELESLLADLTTANQRLRELDRLKSEFLSTMSHELRTPLNSIIGFTGILLDELSGPLNPEQGKQLGLVQSSARHLLALINDLLDLSRIESGHIELHPEPFDFAAVVAETVSFLTPIAQQKAIALHTDCVPAAMPLIGDRRRILQVLLNLVTNAVKFTARGEVAIRARQDDRQLVVAVHDTGIGIRPDQLPHLFEAFRQLDASAHRHYEGTGLGLHLCRKLLALLGGAITVESTAGVGSTFTFTLPLGGTGLPGGAGFIPAISVSPSHGSGDPCHAPPGGAGFTPAMPSSTAP